MLRRETEGTPDRLAAALAGLRRYQDAPRTPPPPPMPVIASAGRAVLHDYAPGGAGPAVLFVPSLVNPASVLDLAPDRSLLRWLATQGVRPLLLDWGTAGPSDAPHDIAGHVEGVLLPLVDALPTPPALVGYCLGGTMAAAVAALRPVPALALIATPWTFGAYPDAARADLARYWVEIAPAVRRLGLFPIEYLQALFWRLDPARTVARFVGFATDTDVAVAAATLLEDWANDGAPLTLAAAEELFVGFLGDDTPGRGAGRVAGQCIDPATLACPVLDIVSTADRIVPAATALSATAAHATRLALGLGHVGMVAGSRAPAQLWRPLRDWLGQAAPRW